MAAANSGVSGGKEVDDFQVAAKKYISNPLLPSSCPVGLLMWSISTSISIYAHSIYFFNLTTQNGSTTEPDN